MRRCRAMSQFIVHALPAGDVRAYDAEAMMLDADVVPGERLAARTRALLGPGVAFLHAHFAGPGCFAFRIERAG